MLTGWVMYEHGLVRRVGSEPWRPALRRRQVTPRQIARFAAPACVLMGPPSLCMSLLGAGTDAGAALTASAALGIAAVMGAVIAWRPRQRRFFDRRAPH